VRLVWPHLSTRDQAKIPIRAQKRFRLISSFFSDSGNSDSASSIISRTAHLKIASRPGDTVEEEAEMPKGTRGVAGRLLAGAKPTEDDRFKLRLDEVRPVDCRFKVTSAAPYSYERHDFVADAAYGFVLETGICQGPRRVYELALTR
jgi:hypothetical protein